MTELGSILVCGIRKLSTSIEAFFKSSGVNNGISLPLTINFPSLTSTLDPFSIPSVSLTSGISGTNSI